MPLELKPLTLSGTYEVFTRAFEDHRGCFARWFCAEELRAVMDERAIVNVNFSATVKQGAVRGLHFQKPPRAEMKLVRCIKGAVYDVMVDIRRDSPTFLQSQGVELSAAKMNMLVIPEGYAHGFQALTDNVEFVYLTTEFYSPEYEGGLNILDPAFNIELPLPVSDISTKDEAWEMCSDSGFAGVCF